MVEVSVIIPVFNGEKTISKTLESLANSYYSNFEVIVCNDGSTDKTLQKIKSFFNKNQNLNHKIIDQTINLGRSEARNICIKKSAGKYIALLDADDQIHPERLKKQVQFLDKNLKIDVIGSSQSLLFTDKKIKISNPPINDKNIKASLFVRTTMLHPTIMIRKEFLLKRNIKYRSNYRYCEDYIFLLDIYFKGGKFANIHNTKDKYKYFEKKKWKFKEFIDSEIKIRKIVLKSINMKLNKENINYLNILSFKTNINNFYELFGLLKFILIASLNLNGKYGGLIFFYYQRLRDIAIILKIYLKKKLFIFIKPTLKI